MPELFSILGAIQDGGGVMLLFFWLVMEVRGLRHDFVQHRHDDDGVPFIKVEGSK